MPRRLIYSLAQAAEELRVTQYYAEKRLGKPLPRSNASETRYWPASSIEELRFKMQPPQPQTTILSQKNIARLTREL